MFWTILVAAAVTLQGAKMPAPVAATLKQKWPAAVVKNVSSEKDASGKLVYEVETTDAGKRRDVNFYADGTVILYEEEIAASEVPAVVLNAIKQRYPKATITLYERLYTMKDNSANFEFGLKGAGKVAEVILTPEGTWVEPKLGK